MAKTDREDQLFYIYRWKRGRLTRMQRNYKLARSSGVWEFVGVALANNPWAACLDARYRYPRATSKKRLKAMPTWTLEMDS